ncbi:hypothetical protein [Rouxiella badensis]|uniref:hypothetical protein n=1 Tax=Rouxiella badensis TaxID=1646377 RepID=UPI0022AB1AAA|nr:hypothetical protein [Rouxiella badensis]WAT08862.1 hypothetical protein O1V65_22005 [Rouxiella badensis]
MSKFVKVAIYGIWGLFLFFASIDNFGDYLGAGNDLWSVIMLTVAGGCQLVAALIAISWAVLAFGTIKSKYLPYKLINNYTVPLLIIGLIVVASFALSLSDEHRAEKLGFKDGEEFSIARENNIENVADYVKFKKDIEIKEKEEKIKEKEKAAHDALLAADKEQKEKQEEKQKEAKCFNDAYCYASKHKDGDYVCKIAVENSAKYEFKWTDGILEQKFSSYSWYDKSNKLVTLFGNRAQAQNGFGAFKNVEYSCTFNADTGEVLNVTLQ